MAATAEGPAALERADEAWGRGDYEAVVSHLSAAIRAFTAAEDRCQAAMVCLRLGDTFANAMGNLTASRAWFARARRLVEDQPPCLEQGWVAVAGLGCDVADPRALLAGAELALDLARRFGDVNLETKALADAGLAHVRAGRVAHGMSLLDEAMALACGPADDSDAAGKSVCSFFTACYYAADFRRAGSWADLLRHQGLIGTTPGVPVFLASHCDSVQASLLVELGRWGEAEALLERSRAEFESAMGMPSWHPDIALADLRIRQGRLTDAEMLLVGKDQSLDALLPAAHLHLARGDVALARATALRGLRSVRDDRVRGAELLALLVETELAAGDLEAAQAWGEDLEQRAGGLGIASVQARSAAVRARALSLSGRSDDAVAMLEEAIDALDPHELPWLRMTLLVDLARRREEAGDRAGATLDARAAAAAAAALDVVLGADDLALLERLAATPTARPGSTAVLRREGRRWLAAHEGASVLLAETKGLRHLVELLAHPGLERHALDLVDRVEGADLRGGLDRRALGDAGPLLDGDARRAYRHRIEQLRAECDQALAEGRLDAAEAGQHELDQLVAQLAAAFGLGGRDRRAASAGERARLNVTRALRGAIANIAEALPAAGAALDRRVRTGIYCAYEPVDGEIRWTVPSAVNAPGPR